MTTKTFLQGMCYDAFPRGYNLDNNTCLWFGSDMARSQLKPLWGPEFTPIGGPDRNKTFKGRNDIKNIADLGINLIRLYDWDPRNDHIPFLDHCHANGIKVLAPVSNYNLGAFGAAPDMTTSIRNLIKSFTKDGDYHPAIYAILIGSELDLPSQMRKSYLAEYTIKWLQIEDSEFSNYRKLPIGHPTSFAITSVKNIYGLDIKYAPDARYGYPCLDWWSQLIAPIGCHFGADKVSERIILCPNTYNEASYLYDNAQESGKGWVDIAIAAFNLPILFTEIGCSRLVRSDYAEVIRDQLTRSIEYAKANDKLLGVCYFQYCDKVWMSNTTEGAFGIMRNTNDVTDVVKYGPDDFCHKDGMSCENESLNVQVLAKNPSYDTIRSIFKE